MGEKGTEEQIWCEVKFVVVETGPNRWLLHPVCSHRRLVRSQWRQRLTESHGIVWFGSKISSYGALLFIYISVSVSMCVCVGGCVGVYACVQVCTFTCMCVCVPLFDFLGADLQIFTLFV